MIIECDDELRSHPQVVDIERALQRDPPPNFFGWLPLFERVLASTLPLAALKCALRRIATEADFQLSRFVMEDVLKGWTFLVTDQFALSIGVRRPMRAGVDPEPPVAEVHGPRIQPYPFDLFIGCLGGGYDFQRYSLAESEQGVEAGGGPGGGEAAQPALAWQASGRMSAGSSLVLRAGLDMLTSNLPGALVYLEITGPQRCPILPQFDQHTLGFSGWVSGDTTASRLELLTRTLAEFGFSAAAPRVAALTRHRDHYVRWNSLRHLLRLDPRLGVEHLQQARLDEHPEIRALAGWTLGRLASRSAQER